MAALPDSQQHCQIPDIENTYMKTNMEAGIYEDIYLKTDRLVIGYIT